MRRLIQVIGVLCFTGMTTAILDSLFGANFLPSAKWAGDMGGIVFVSSLVPGGIVTFALFQHDPSMQERLKTNETGIKAFFYAIGISIFVALGLSLFVFHTVPSAHALLVRERVTHEFVVAHNRPSNSKGCRNGLVLERLPFMQDSICDVRPHFFEFIEEGDRVAVTGIGSSLGVFVGTYRMVGL